MNWKEFKNWLDTNIIEVDNDKVILNKEAETKYQLTNSFSSSTQINEQLTNFYRSLEATLDNEKDCWHLPVSLINKTWNQLFPDLNGVHFGAKTNQELLPQDIYDTLGKIYHDWQTEVQEEETVENLTKQAQQLEKDSEKYLKEYMSQEALRFFKSKGINYIPQLRKWLVDCNKLSGEKSYQLDEEKKKILEVLAIFEFGEKNFKEEKEPKKHYFADLPWKQIVWYGGGILLIILVIGWLHSKFKGK